MFGMCHLAQVREKIADCSENSNMLSAYRKSGEFLALDV
jgi:hypothetical protein